MAGDDGLVDVPPNDPDILFEGRVDCTNPAAPAFSFPGVSIRARFAGDTLQMKLSDFGAGDPKTANRYDVLVDGRTPTELEVAPHQNVYTLATGLPPGPHTVEIIKRTESFVGKAVFGGFRIRAGTALVPPAPRPHRIEFIGDSITCGYGDMVSIHDPSRSHFTAANENENLAWGGVTARALDAELMVVAYSGRGIYRNYEDGPGDTLPRMYLKTLPDDPASAAWNPSVAIPDVLVVNLGTNDFSPPGHAADSAVRGTPDTIDHATYTRTYVEFLRVLRGYYPKATFVVAAGPMLSDQYPPGYKAWTNIQADLANVVAARKAAGDPDVHALFIPPQAPPFGEDYHPTAAEQQTMSDALVAVIKQLKGW
jgi:lysophospholipase L1-like esterase